MATFIQAPLPVAVFSAVARDNQEPDDMYMIPETILLGGASIAATYLAAGGQVDLICIPGAMLGAVVALLKAAQEKRLWTDKGIILIGSSVIGTTLPSGAVHILWPEWMEKLTWHVFFLAGFICSIIGWMLIWPIVLLLDARREKIARAALRAAELKFGVSTDSTAGTKSPRH